jgi:hypothetical protein
LRFFERRGGVVSHDGGSSAKRDCSFVV